VIGIGSIDVIDVTTDVIDVIVRVGRSHPPRRGYMPPSPLKWGDSPFLARSEILDITTSCLDVHPDGVGR
jgi:hypothetical protein